MSRKTDLFHYRMYFARDLQPLSALNESEYDWQKHWKMAKLTPKKP
jgi:hypothetical protein